MSDEAVTPGDHIDWLVEQGVGQAAASDSEGALQSFSAVVKARPNHAEAWHQIGLLAARSGRLSEAKSHLSRALECDPANSGAAANIGFIFKAEGDIERAKFYLKQAHGSGPWAADVQNALGAIAMQQHRFADACVFFRRVTTLQPNSAVALCNLGGALNELGEYNESVEILTQALALQPDFAEAFHNLAIACQWLGKFDLALDGFAEAARHRPDDGRFAYHLGGEKLRFGRLDAGWDLFEHRFFEEGLGERTFKKRYRVPPPYWGGEDLRGRRLVVWREQGLGDEILGVGMVPDVMGRAAECVLVCNPRLRRIHERSFPGARVLSFGDLADFGSLGCDYQTPLGSLGRFLRRDFGSFPRHTGYLKADPEKVERFRRKYAALAQGRRVVGVSWRSQRKQLGPAKSADLSGWSDVLKVPGVWWVNLQYGDCTAELAAVKAKLGVEVYQDADVDPMGDLDDFFAQVAALDLLVSTSNTAVHVAGSLNVPAWVLLPRGGGSMWYWFLDRSDSPWYPSVRLFRETDERVADRPWWRAAVTEVGAELKSWAGHG